MSVTSVHRDHDELLIVRAAGGDAGDVDARLARQQADACDECRALFADVAAIRASTNASVLRVPRRPRSFRIDPEALARARMPAWRRALSGFGAPRYDVLRPLAGTVAGIGLAVMVLGSLSVGASPAAAPMRDLAASPGASEGSGEVYAAPSNPAVPVPGATQGDRNSTQGGSAGATAGPASSPPALVSGSGGESGPSVSPVPAAEAPGASPGKAVDSGRPASTPVSPAAAPGVPLGLIGAVLLLVGVGVFLAQTAARRAALR